MFIVVVKQIEAMCKTDPTFARKTFDPAYRHQVTVEDAPGPGDSLSKRATSVVKKIQTKEKPKTPPRGRPKDPPRNPPKEPPGAPPKEPPREEIKTPPRPPTRPGVKTAPVDLDPYPEEGIDPSLLELVCSRCSALANKFLPEDISNEEFQDLSQRLFKRFTSELLLAQRMKKHQTIDPANDDGLQALTNHMVTGTPMPTGKGKNKKTGVPVGGGGGGVPSSSPVKSSSKKMNSTPHADTQAPKNPQHNPMHEKAPRTSSNKTAPMKDPR